MNSGVHHLRGKSSISTFAVACLSVLLVLLLAAPPIVAAENEEIAAGMAIVCFGMERTPAQAQADLGAGYVVRRELIRDMGVYSVTFTPSIAVSTALLDLRTNSKIQWAMPNQRMEKRGCPTNDQSNQWHLGVVGAADAWCQTTGAKNFVLWNPVVAIVDGGANLANADLSPNLWVNPGEDLNRNGIIDPAECNNIDDDGNGLVDDFNGINAYVPSGNIPNDLHGTEVALAAVGKGNNSVSGVGIAYDSKAMIVAAESNFAEIILAGYGYIDAMKQRWIETASEGANIIAISNTFGIPQHFCSEVLYEGWGLVIHHLGEYHGILTIAATANEAIDVDVVGDVPSTCETPYLVVVTNTDQNDEKNTGAAWGQDNVDMGAPGTAIVTNAGTETGTSMAAPLVAGTAALMGSVANPSFFEKVAFSTTQAGAALTLKDMLYSASDANGSLSGITTTGKRLNTANAVQAMANFYVGGQFNNSTNVSPATAHGGSVGGVETSHGRHTLHKSGSELVYTWYREGEGTSREYRMTYSADANREFAIGAKEDPTTNTTRVFIVTRHNGQLVLYRHAITGTPGSPTTYNERWWPPEILWINGFPGDAQFTAPAVLADGFAPLVLCGVWSPTQPALSGVYVWISKYQTNPDPTGEHQWLADPLPLPGSEGEHPRCVAGAVQEPGDNYPFALWVSEGMSSIIQWSRWRMWPVQSGDVDPDPQFQYTDISDISMAMGTAGSCLLVWDGVESGRRNLYSAFGDIYNPFSTNQVCISSGIADFATPSIHANRDRNGFGLAYTKTYLSTPTLPQIEFRAYAMNWYTFGIPVYMGSGTNPTVICETEGDGYEVLVTTPLNPHTNRAYAEVRVSHPCWTCPMAIPREHLSVAYGTVPLEPPIDINHTIIVEDGGALEIDGSGNTGGGTGDCRMAAGTSIKVMSGSILSAFGSEKNPLNIVPQSASPDSEWYGIQVEGGQLTMEYVRESGADSACVSVINPEKIGTDHPVDIDHCTFDGSTLVAGGDAVRIWGNPEPSEVVVISNSTIENVATDARGLYLLGCPVDVEALTVRDCNSMNSLIEDVTGSFHNCTFATKDNIDRPTDYGVVLQGTATTPLFTCCTFENIAPPAGTAIDALAGTAPIFGWESEPASNVFREDADITASLLRMYGDAPLPVITLTQDGGGENDWFHVDEYGIFIRWDDWPSWTYPAWKQYWDPTPTVDNFYPIDPYAFDFAVYETDPWGVCGTARATGAGRGGDALAGGGLDEANTDSALFRQAVDAERLGNYSVAQGLFGTLARTTTLRGLRWQAMAHAVGTQRHLVAEAWIPGLIDSLIAAENNAYAARVYGQRLLSAYRMDRAEYPAAAALCAGLLSSGLTRRDSLLVALDLVGVQLRSGFQTSGGGLDADAVPSPLKVRSVPEGLRLQHQLLTAMKGANGGRAAAPAVLPTKYALYQNYPNPFNPATEIRFDLPAKVQVELKIFNTLGQLVTTLVNEARPAGAYTVQWDGKNAGGMSVSTGMYIYQLKTGDFTDTKKMLLMK